MDETWEPNAKWLDVENGIVSGDEMEPLEEVARRLRSYRRTDLIAVTKPVARYEQGLQPYFLAPEDERLIKDLLAIGDDPIALDEFTRPIDAERLRDLVRRTLIEWDRPGDFVRDLHPYLHRQQDHVLWLVETVAIGLTAVGVRVSVSGQLPTDIPYPDSYPADLVDPERPHYDLHGEWWQGYGTDLRLSDDVGTRYQQSTAVCEFREYPVRTRVDGRWEANVCECYRFLYQTGIPAEARELTLSGHINLAVEEPTTGPMPWPKRDLSLGDFSYTIDLTHWWPPEVNEDFMDYLRREDKWR